MSLLMFEVSNDHVYVMVDTLAVTPQGEPLTLVTKCGVVPHLNMVIAGTGIAQLPDRWRDLVYSQMLARDIDQLDAHTPDGLRRLWAELIDEHPWIGAGGNTTTLYHFGLSEMRGQYAGYAYRSANNFVSEPMLQGGFGFKPAPEPPLELEVPTTIEGWIACASELQTQQNSRPVESRIHIGGELIFYILQDGAITLRKVHRYDDFEENWHRMDAALSGR